MSQIQELFDNAKVSQKKKLAVLIDPDKIDVNDILSLSEKINRAEVDFVFVGGSLLTNSQFHTVIEELKQNIHCPLVIFPGHPTQICKAADGILLLSLISGRNPELLIGQHVHAAPVLKQSNLEILPTGYILIDGGKATSVSYISNTQPIPADKSDIAASTALAGEMLGLRNIYLEAGSGANEHVSVETIQAVRSQTNIPLIVGGGIRDAATALKICKAGADIIVVGNAIEKDNSLMLALAKTIHGV